MSVAKMDCLHRGERRLNAVFEFRSRVAGGVLGTLRNLRDKGVDKKEDMLKQNVLFHSFAKNSAYL